MTMNEAIEKFKHQASYRMKPSSIQTYGYLLVQLGESFGSQELNQIQPEEIRFFLDRITHHRKQNTKHMRFTQLKAFFNYCINVLKVGMTNPCKDEIISKSYRVAKLPQKNILPKEIMDEVIYKTAELRDRLIIELQARSGLRIGEVLKLRACDLDGRKLTLMTPKSGNENELAFLPTTLAERLKNYIVANHIQPDNRIFGMSYSGARYIVKSAGERSGVHLRPHDLRRHSATYASRNGVPLEVISKMILRHQDLKTTQVYLGKITDSEALQWMDSLHGK